MRVIVNNRIWVRRADLPSIVENSLIDALTIDNQEYIKAKDRHLPTKGISKKLVMFEIEGEWLTLPRGFASQLIEGLGSFDIPIELEDERTLPSGDCFRAAEEIPARPYQVKLIERILEMEQGIGEAPTGSGKTVAVLEAFRQIAGKSLVIVNTKEIADQWIERTKQWLGEDVGVGLIGDGEFDDSQELTIAIQASLWSKRKQLEQDGFFKQFAAVCMDECHHATADTYRFVADLFWSVWRFGVSATPEKTGDFELAQNILGEIFTVVTEEDVKDQVIKPKVKVIQTKFGARFKGDKVMANGWVRRNNYPTILKKLTEDQKRNQLIAVELIEHHWPNANLVLSKRIKHLEMLHDAIIAEGYDPDNLLTIIGADSRQERRDAIERIEDAECVVFSTLADEALDAPRLDRLFLTFPTRNPDLVRQQIGRIRRRHPKKKDAWVIDFRDMQVGPFEKQYMIRRHECYDPLKLEVVKV